MAAPALRIFVLEDDLRVRKHLVELLDGEPGMRVVGDAGDVDEALEKLSKTKADVALVDLNLPGKSGVDFITALGRGGPQVLVHTVRDDRTSVLAAVRAGACGYVLKGSPPRELVEALYNLDGGGAPMTPKIARAVLRELQEPPAGPDLLTPRERQVLQLVERGLSYKELASELGISVNSTSSCRRATSGRRSPRRGGAACCEHAGRAAARCGSDPAAVGVPLGRLAGGQRPRRVARRRVAVGRMEAPVATEVPEARRRRRPAVAARARAGDGAGRTRAARRLHRRHVRGVPRWGAALRGARRRVETDGVRPFGEPRGAAEALGWRARAAAVGGVPARGLLRRTGAGRAGRARHRDRAVGARARRGGLSDAAARSARVRDGAARAPR
ncbi:MAG: response regulator transcription factor [Myxococcaceae bacterium]|nr:response regulator transcription factor [Myxococcaceae bacterium]